MPALKQSEITEIAETSASSSTRRPTQQSGDSPMDQIMKSAETLSHEKFHILKGKQQLLSRKRQAGERLSTFIARKSASFLTNGAIELITLSNDITILSKKKIENAIKSKEKGAVKKEKTLQILGIIPTAIFLFPAAFISATADSLLSVDTAGRRNTANKFPEWQNVYEAENRLSNDTKKLAEDAKKLINEGELSPEETRKLTAIAEQLDAEAQNIAGAANSTAKLALRYQPTKGRIAAEVASPVQPTNEAKLTDQPTSPTTSFQERLSGKKRSFSELEETKGKTSNISRA